MPSWKAWLLRPSSLFKRGRKRWCFYGRESLIKVENVLEERNFQIDLNNYQILIEVKAILSNRDFKIIARNYLNTLRVEHSTC
jgi:hypothetical protein